MKIIIPHSPIPAARPRVTHRGTYNPKQREQIDTTYIIKQQYTKQPLTTPLEVTLLFFMPIPKRMSIKKRKAILGQPHTIKSDLDNLVKFSLDCMNGIVYKDDAQIYEIVAQKVYSDNPRTEITILEYKND